MNRSGKGGGPEKSIRDGPACIVVEPACPAAGVYAGGGSSGSATSNESSVAGAGALLLLLPAPDDEDAPLFGTPPTF